ncbi:MAG: hypothetical protein ABIZ50_04490, partial [Solirubrobacterales bacterium]
QQLAELGVIGLVLLLGVLAAAVAATWRAAKRLQRLGQTELAVLARSILTAQVGALSAYVFIPNGYNKILWVLLALGPVLGTIAAGREQLSVEGRR